MSSDGGSRQKNNMKKITVLTLNVLLFALCFSAEAQQPTKVARIGHQHSPYSWSTASKRIPISLLCFVHWRRLHAAEVGGIRLLLFAYWLSG